MALGFTDEALEDWDDLPRSAKLYVAKAITKLETEPEKRGQPLGSQQIGNLTGFKKLRAGQHKEYRIVFRVDPGGDVAVMWVIGPRSDDEAYQLAVARLRMNPNPAISTLIDSLDELWER